MLRLALIENLRRVAARLSYSRAQQNLAATWADQMTEAEEKDPTTLIMIIADMARSNPPMDGAFVAEIVRRLQGRGPGLALPLTWIEQRLSQNGGNIELFVTAEIQQQAADQLSVSNSIGSLRFLGKTDWREFVETLSRMESILTEDPSGFYGLMDFATRDIYRHKVERIAKQSAQTEEYIAQKVIEMARNAPQDASFSLRHVGYYLIGKGLPDLEKISGAQYALAEKLRNAAAEKPLLVYLGSIALFTGVVSVGLMSVAISNLSSLPLLGLVAVLSIIGSSHFAVSFVNWMATMLARPSTLPRLDYSSGIPEDARTLVVVPTLLTSIDGIDQLCEDLEVRFLANATQNLHFSLLTDFSDADTETKPEDFLLIERAKENIQSLKSKIFYRRAGHLLPFPSSTGLECTGKEMDGF